MFKGLRTKIESEQKGDKSLIKTNPSSQLTENIVSTIIIGNDSVEQQPNVENKNAKNKNISSTNEFSSKVTSTTLQTKLDGANRNLSDNIKLSQNDTSIEEDGQISNSGQKEQQQNQESTQSHRNEDLFGQITDLKCEVLRLHEQLRSVIKEKDESNDQNAQLYQLIEKLRRDLESEKETNTSLQDKLDHVQKETYNKSGTSGSISIKLFDPFNNNNNHDISTEPQNIDNYKRKINELQSQLTDKNRQLKIKQQNLNDIRRALQKEMLEHGKTQDELNKMHNQLKQLQISSNLDNLNECQSLQNGSSTHSDNDSKNNFNPSSGDKQQQQSNQEAVSQLSLENNNKLNDELVVGLEIGSGLVTPQLDKISYLSRSSASVDELDSNDLQQNSCSIGVNHEYLRNVLYRYMTSTDTETARHLVKALSVLMNFTPEQSAAIKSAMNSRSSWLRLR